MYIDGMVAEEGDSGSSICWGGSTQKCILLGILIQTGQAATESLRIATLAEAIFSAVGPALPSGLHPMLKAEEAETKAEKAELKVKELKAELLQAELKAEFKVKEAELKAELKAEIKVKEAQLKTKDELIEVLRNKSEL